jgi:hypothetical protein
MIKKYTNYRISLNGSFKNVESLLTLWYLTSFSLILQDIKYKNMNQR